MEENNQPLKVDEVTFKGPLETGQVLVRIHYSGICGKQIEEIKGTAGPDPYLPHLLGHEGSGVVADTGPGVKKVLPGDRVVLQWVKGSGMDAVTPRYARDGRHVNAGWITTFNEYGVVPENRVTKIPKDTDLSVACLLGCAVTTGVGVILNEARVRPGESVAVFGCGGVGLNAIQGALYAKAYPIIAVDREPESLKMASEFGATHFINSKSEDVLGEIKKITQDKGANFVIITAASPAFIEAALETSSIPGSVYLAGVPPAGSKITIDALSIHRKRTLTGSYGGGCVPDRDIVRYLELYRKGHIKLKELIFKVVTLEDIGKGVGLLMCGSPGRCIVDMTEVSDQVY